MSWERVGEATHVEEERIDALKIPLSVRDHRWRQGFFDVVGKLLYTTHIRVMIRPFLFLRFSVVHVLRLGVEDDGWDQESTFARVPSVFLLWMSESRHEEVESCFPDALRSKVGLDVDLADDWAEKEGRKRREREGTRVQMSRSERFLLGTESHFYRSPGQLTCERSRRKLLAPTPSPSLTP